MVQFKNILFPINLDSSNLSHITEAIEFAKTYKSRIHFLYVNDPMAGYRHPTDFQDAVALRVKETISPSLLDNCDVVYAVSKGDLGDEVQKYCQENKIDLIITGHKQRNKLYAALLENPETDIINTVKIPILIIPKK